MNNLRQISLFMQLYTDENQDTFPAHRDMPWFNPPSGDPLDNWWGQYIVPYSGGKSNLFMDPAIKGPQRFVDGSGTWQWAFTRAVVGYGYNAYFLGAYPWTTAIDPVDIGSYSYRANPWFRRSSIKRPTDTLEICDEDPKPAGVGGQPADGFSAWWPKASEIAPSYSRQYQGVSMTRHGSLGNVVFTDGHAESRKDADINPPVDPLAKNSSKCLINSRYWDPLQRAGDR
jgi:prepilin-type processing-associated H-X9-DG protein